MPILKNQPNERREQWADAKRIVVKIGTHLLVDETGQPNSRKINGLVKQIATCQQHGKQMVLVSSGAIAAGMPLLGHKRRPRKLVDCQLAAAVGQTRLLHQYQRAFAKHDCVISQMLLTHMDLKQRTRHLNARNTLLNSFRHRIIPIINENDVVSVDEIKFGDNDMLSALVSTLIDADLLILLTTIDGLHHYINAKQSERIPYINKLTNKHYSLIQAKKNNTLSTGGMHSKLDAAKVALQNGVPVVIASGEKRNVMLRILAGEDIGTLLDVSSSQRTLAKRKGWIRFFNRVQGTLHLDDGATSALQTGKKSLLPSGIAAVDGKFSEGALVALADLNGIIIGHGLIEFNSDDAQRIRGHHSRDIAKLLQGQYPDEVIHRDNLIIFDE